jgi:hypothetical protein
MAWLRRAAVLIAATAVALGALAIGNPDPPQARASVPCDVGTSPAGAVTGAIGIGNPVGDACDAVTDPVLGVADHALDPLKDAASSLGKGVFDQITTWATNGAVWLLGEVVELTQETTSPDLLGKGFLRSYRQMASIATVLAALMLLFAVLESLGRGDAGMLWRVFLVNVPLAAIATSAAYVVVQLLIGTCDGFCEVIAHSTGSDTRAFFKGAVQALAGVGGAVGTTEGTATVGKELGHISGAAGAAEVPLFVGFIAAFLAAFAAFLVWIELLMRDAAIYIVALFAPIAIAASIWPRWTSALRRTAELLIVVVFSKFVIVAIIALAASLLAHTGGKVEQVLAAGALLLLACFAPFVLFKLVPFAEGAVSAAYSRQGAGGVAVQATQMGGSVSMMRRAAQANWSASSRTGGSAGGGRGSGGGGGGKGPGGPPGGEAAGAAGGAAGVAALPLAAGVGAAKAGRGASERLSGTAIGQDTTEAASHPAGAGSAASSARQTGGGEEFPPRPHSSKAGPNGEPRGAQTGSTPEPTEASGGKAPGSATKPPRPAADGSATGKGGAGGKGKP